MMKGEVNACGDLALNKTTLEPAYNDEEQPLLQTHDWDLAEQLKGLMRAAKLIVSSTDDSPFTCGENSARRIKYVKMNRLARTTVLALKCDIWEISKYFKNHKFHPLLELAIKAASKRKLFDRAWTIETEVNSFAVDFVDAFNAFVQLVRRIGRSEKFKRRVRIFERRSNDNFLQFKRYVEAHYKKRSRLLWLRVDLWYRDEYLTAVDRDPVTVYRRIKRDWKALHHDLKQKIFKKAFRGFVWKLEYGISRSWHLHVVIILDSSKLKSDITLAKILGDHWNKVVTQNRGGYFNCNAKKMEYKFGSIGIGEIHRDDEDMRRALLERVGGYITKPDLIVALQTPDGGRCFGKGNAPT